MKLIRIRIKKGLLIEGHLRTAEDDVPFDDLPEWQQEELEDAIDVIENFDDYEELPKKFEINEYQMMEDFCFHLTDQKKTKHFIKSHSGKRCFQKIQR